MGPSVSIAEQFAAFRRVLLQLRSRYRRWAIVCVVSFCAVTTLAVLTRAAVFAVVAAFFAFFAWDRTLQWRRADRYLSKPLPNDEAEMLAWAERVSCESCHVPTWEKISHWVAWLTAAGLAIMQTAVIWFTSGFWMKMLYAVGWAVVILLLSGRAMGITIYSARLAHVPQQSPEPENGRSRPSDWRDAT
jgi:hypothetical protein